MTQRCRPHRAVFRHTSPTKADVLVPAEYNAGSLNIDEYLRRLVTLSHDLSARNDGSSLRT